MLVILATYKDIYHVVTMTGHILPLFQLLYKQKGLLCPGMSTERFILSFNVPCLEVDKLFSYVPENNKY